MPGAIDPGMPPMEAKLVAELPDGDGWWFEPKWDGFRCLAYRDGGDVDLRSKSGKPLGRYFPDIVALLERTGSARFALDGELLIPVGETLSFEALQMRLHPAESRVRKLVAETPAQFVLFDCLMGAKGAHLVDCPLTDRREALESWYSSTREADLLLSPFSRHVVAARGWLARSGVALDGVIAKRADEPYRPGERAMLKVKTIRTADCVIGGFRYGEGEKLVGSLLLGLYDDEGLLNHVGFTSAIAAADKPELTRRLEKLVGPPGFTGKAPGGPSRWSNARSAEWQPLKAELVAEVRYDQVTADRFRHGTGFLRWRPDKAPEQCRMDQLEQEASPIRIAARL